ALVLLQLSTQERYWPHGWLNIPIGNANIIVLITSSITTVMAWTSCKMNQFGRFKFFYACTILLAMTFVCIKSYEYHDKFTHYEITLNDGKIFDGHLESKTLKLQDGAWTGSIKLKGHEVTDRKELYDLKAPGHHAAAHEEKE